jgi:phosphopantothenoylcysteine synthetase/decarboxylase
VSPLGFLVCGAPLASRADEAAQALAQRGWSLSVGVTDAANGWITAGTLTKAATLPAATQLRASHGEQVQGRPDKAIAFPLTFNTANKIARGVMDNQVTGTLCDCLGTGAPIVAALFVNDRLWGHPVWSQTLDTLTAAGVMFLDPHSGRLGKPVPVRSGTGGDVVAAFDSKWVVDAAASL